MKTAEYAALRGRSRYFLAYAIERMLGDETARISRFQLLLGGIWYDGDKTHADRDYLNAMLSESDAEIGSVDDEDRPYVQAITVYLTYWSGDKERARKLLAAIQKPDGDRYLSLYIERIRACIGSGVTDDCRPDSLIDFDNLLGDNE